MRVGPLDQGEADGHLGAEADDGRVNMGSHEGADGFVDVARIRGEERAEKEQYLPSSMGRSMALSQSVHSKNEDSRCPVRRKKKTYHKAARAMSRAFCRLG